MSLHRMIYNSYSYQTAIAKFQNFENEKSIDKLKNIYFWKVVHKSVILFLKIGVYVIEHIKVNTEQIWKISA